MPARKLESSESRHIVSFANFKENISFHFKCYNCINTEKYTEEGIKPYFKLVSSFTQGLSGIFIFFVILVWPKRGVFTDTSPEC